MKEKLRMTLVRHSAPSMLLAVGLVEHGHHHKMATLCRTHNGFRPPSSGPAPPRRPHAQTYNAYLPAEYLLSIWLYGEKKTSVKMKNIVYTDI